MKLAQLIQRNVWRNRRRTTLTGAGIALAVFVVTSVTALNEGFATLAGSGGDSLLTVYEKNVACPVTSRIFDSYLSNIRSLPSVVSATGVLTGVFTYQRKENLVPVEGIEYETFRSMGGIRVLAGREADFAARRDGALVGRRIAERYGWHVGDTVSMVEGLTLHVDGTFSSPDATYEREVLVHKPFLESVERDEGKSTYLLVQVADATAVAPVSRSIDDALANYPRPTKTQSEKAAKAQQSRDFGALRLMLAGLVLATVLASVFGAANSVSMSVRERSREVGILRSLGFRRRHVLEILIGESVLVSVIGGLAGVAASWQLFATEKMVGGAVPVVVGPGIATFGLGIAVFIGLLGALVPAMVASGVSIVDTLRVVD